MKKQRNYDKKVKHTRILLSDYLLLKGYADSTGVSMSQALHKLITGQLKPKPEPKPEPAPIPVPVSFKLKAIESDGAAPVKLKFIESAEDIRVKLKSIR